MYEIKDNITNSIVINKSNFITCLYKVYTLNDIKDILDSIKTKYKDATHYCYAYILETKIKSSDDGEPSGTAGIPILEILNKNCMTNILCIVIRYFGGVKLGASGLIRAYGRSANEAIKKAILLKLIPSKIIELSFNYDKIKIVDNILKDEIIIDKQFSDFVKYRLNVSDLNIVKSLQDISEINIIGNSVITKENK